MGAVLRRCPWVPSAPRPRPPGALQAGAVRAPGRLPAGSFTVLVGEQAGRTFAVAPGREREVAESMRRMGSGVMDANV